MYTKIKVLQALHLFISIIKYVFLYNLTFVALSNVLGSFYVVAVFYKQHIL